MTILLYPAYLPNIAHFTAISQADEVEYEAFGNYQKQTFRNRANIYGANGLLPLNIPVRYSQKNRQLYKDVEIAYDEDWQLNHRRSIESAYRTSPFFEYYEDDILPIYSKKEKYLFDFNIKVIEILREALQIDLNYNFTTEFKLKGSDEKDLRHLVNAKNQSPCSCTRYTQVFDDKHGFISNLSVLDLICNEGPNSANYLMNEKLF